MAKSKLSDREKAAAKAGVAVDYSKSAKQQVKPLQPAKLALPKTLASKTPQAKLYQAQKSQPIAQKSNFMKSDPVRLTGIPKSTPVVSKKPVTESDTYKRALSQAQAAQAQAKKQGSFFGIAKNTLKGTLKSVKDILAPTYGYSQSELNKTKATGKEKLTGLSRSVAEIPAGLGELASNIGKKTQEKIARTKVGSKLADIGQKITEYSKPKTAGEAKFQQIGNIASNFIPGGVAGRTGKLSKETGDAVNAAIRAGKTSEEINRIISTGSSKASKGIFDTIKNKAKGLFSSVGKQSEKNSVARSGITDLAEQQRIAAANRAKVADSMRTPRALAAENADEALKTLSKTDGTSSNVRNIRFNEPKIGTPEFSPRTPSASNAGRIARDEAPKSIPKGRTELPKRNTNKANDLFEEPDDLGRSKVFTNVREGDGSLKRVEIGEFDSTGRFKERIHEDGRPISEVIDEGNRNLAAGKRGVTRLGVPGDARAALKQFEKPQKVGMLQTKKLRDKRGKYAGSESLGANKNVKAGDIRRELSAAKDAIDTDLMMQIERVLPSIREYRGLKDFARHGDRLDEADALEATMKKLASNKAITDEERRGAMEALARLGYGTKTYYGKGMLRKPVYDPKAEGAAKGRIATQNTDALTQEDRKYKSAEEFVFNTKTLFRGTNDEGANLLKAGHIPREGLSVTLDPSVAKKYASSRGLAGYTIEKNLIPGAKVIRLEDVPNTVRSSGEGTDFAGKAAIWAKKQGYDVLDMSKGNEGEMRILNKDVLQTKSQLTSLYHQATGGKKGLLRKGIEARKAGVLENQQSQELLAKSLKDKVPQETLSRPELSVSSSLLDDTTKLKNNQGINLDKLNISDEGKQVIKETMDDMRPNIEAVTGKKLSNSEAEKFVETSGKFLSRTIGREQTLEWQSGLLNLRQKIAAQAESGKVDKNFLNDLLTLKSQSTDIARKLNAFKVQAEAEGLSKSTILQEVLKVNDNIDEILKAAQDVDFNDFEQATNFYRQFVKPKAGEWLDLLRYNSMLSSPNTHLINIFSNLANSSVIAPVEKLVTGGLDFLGGLVGKKRGAFAGEAAHYLAGYAKSFSEAGHRFAGVMKGSRPMTNIDIRNIPIATRGAKGLLVKTLSYPSRLLDGMDQFFTALVEGGETASLIYRKSKGVNVGNITSKAQDASRYRLFRRETFNPEQGAILDAIDHVTNLVNMGRKSKNPIVSTIAKFTVPFINTPMNILKQGIEYSPAGFSTIIGAKNKTEQLSKAIIGSSIFAGSATLLSSGRLTWEEPISEKQKTLFRQAGMQAYSVKIGNKWYSYQKLPPALAFPLSMVAAINDAQKSKKMDEKTGDIILASIAKYGTFLSDQSYARSIGDMIAGARGDQGGLPKIVSNYAQQVVPFRALGGWLARLTDDTQRKIDNQAGFIDKQIQLLMLNIPGVSQKVPARLDSEGNPIKNTHNIINSFSPVRVSENNVKWEKFFNDYKESLRIAQEKSAKLAKVKAQVLETGQPQKVGDTYVYQDKGEIKTSKTDNFTIKPLYEQIQKLNESNPDKAQEIVDNLSDEDYEKYKKVRASVRVKNTEAFRELLKTDPKKAVEFNRSQDEEEGNRLIELLTDEEYDLYERGKL